MGEIQRKNKQEEKGGDHTEKIIGVSVKSTPKQKIPRYIFSFEFYANYFQTNKNSEIPKTKS